MKSTDTELVRDYRQFIPIEQLVTKQIDRIISYRSEKNIPLYEEAIEALIDLLSPEAEDIILKYKKEMDVHFDISSGGKQKYVDMFRAIKKHLADENIIWKRSKGYERGHD